MSRIGPSSPLSLSSEVSRAGHPRHATMLSPLTKLLLPLALGCALSVAVMVFSERSHQRLNQANQLIASSIETQAVASQILALVSDAETAQRGFLLTERPEYLEPYVTAVPKIGPKLQRLKDLNADNPEQRAHVSQLAKLIGEKLAELEATLSLYKEKGPKQAQELIETDVGRRTMDEVRKEIDLIQNAERAELIARSSRWNEDVAFSRFGIAVITLFNLLLVITVYILARRGVVQRERIRTMLEEQVRQRTAELSELSTSLQNVQEEERARLAHDLHDELGSILVSSKMDVSWAYNRLKDKEPLVAQRLARAMTVIDEGVDIKRRIIEDLRPTVLDNLGLPAALEWYVDHIGQRGNLKCTLAIDSAEMELPDAVAIALFRVVQEALTNIVRHANAANAWIAMECQDERILLTVRDDGPGLPKGVERKRLSHGILGMRQRITSLGGEFAIDSPAGGGTVIRVRVPLR
jgi:signal transduction histidine kinase